jgi:hypothetical protein
MIVRISGEDQYVLGEGDVAGLNELESAVVASVEEGREADFEPAFKALLDYTRAHGSRVSDDDLASSDLILPPADLTFAEAGREFTGEGLIPD